MGRLLLVAWLASVGCASAGGGSANPDSGPGSEAGPDIDAPPPVDAAIPVELVQTGSTAIVATEIGCQINDGSRITVENSYYRIFPLADHGVTTPLHITSVTFGVERAVAGNGVSQEAQLRIGTYTGTVDATSFPITALQQLASATIQIPNNATTVTTPITQFTPSAVTLQPGSVMYAELFIPNGEAAGNSFYIGSNNGAETHPSYIRAPECSTPNPATYASVVGASPVIRILLSVSGTR